jgi:hypothetical protein
VAATASATTDDDLTSPIGTDTPFSVVAARMARYLAKREEERQQKKQIEEEAKAEVAKQQQQRNAAARPSSASYAAASAGLPLRATARPMASSAFVLPSSSDTELKRQYQELRARLDGGLGSSGASGSLSHRASSQGAAFRPTSAPVARRPLSAHRR